MFGNVAYLTKVEASLRSVCVALDVSQLMSIGGRRCSQGSYHMMKMARRRAVSKQYFYWLHRTCRRTSEERWESGGGYGTNISSHSSALPITCGYPSCPLAGEPHIDVSG